MADILVKDGISSNILFFGSNECINDIVIERLKGRHHIKKLRQVHFKDIIYKECDKFFVFAGIENENILHCIKDLIGNHSVNGRHLIVITNIERLSAFFFAFRIMLERFYKTSQFVCTTTHLAGIESPIKSRFFLVRQPHKQPVYHPIKAITGIRKKPSVEEISVLSHRLKEAELKDIVCSGLEVTPYKVQYIDIASYIENMYVRREGVDKRAVIELLLLELFYPSHKHTI